jgi:hypothetical protein
VAGASLSGRRLAATLVAVAVASACRSVSVEFGTLPLDPTDVAAPTPVIAQQQVAPATEATRPAARTQVVPTLAPVPSPVLAAAVPAFAPRGEGSSRSGVITNSQQRDTYEFQGQQGQLLEVRAKRTSGVTLQPRIELVDPSGAYEVDSRYGRGPELLVEQKLASTGGYTIVITPYEGSGPYSVAWFLDRFGQLGDGGQVNAEIADPDQKDRYRFDATQGQLLKVQVQRTSGVSLQPWIDLVDPSGARESTADSRGPQVTLETKLASGGSYTLVVGGHDTGPYLVTLSIR